MSDDKATEYSSAVSCGALGVFCVNEVMKKSSKGFDWEERRMFSAIHSEIALLRSVPILASRTCSWTSWRPVDVVPSMWRRDKVLFEVSSWTFPGIIMAGYITSFWASRFMSSIDAGEMVDTICSGPIVGVLLSLRFMMLSFMFLEKRSSRMSDVWPRFEIILNDAAISRRRCDFLTSSLF